MYRRHEDRRPLRRTNNQKRINDCNNAVNNNSNNSNNNTGTIEETFVVPLTERTLDGQISEYELRQIENDIQTQTPDLFVHSQEGYINLVNASILTKMSCYFEAMLRNPVVETLTRRSCLPVNQQFFKVILDFVYQGNITLNASNIMVIFGIANYLQIDSLSDVCRRFLRKYAVACAPQGFALGLMYFEEEVADICVDALIRQPASLLEESYAATVNADLVGRVLSSDDLNVESEDEVCKFFMSWLAASERVDDDVQFVVEFIRVPHLTREMALQLVECLEGRDVELDAWDLCESGRFTDLPEEQLALRNHYGFHAHLFWLDELDYTKGPQRLTLTCTRIGDSRVLTNSTLIHFPHKCVSPNWEIAVVADSVMEIVQNKRNSKIMVYSLGPSGNMRYHTSFERQAELPDFAVCADGSRCMISYFYDFGLPPRFSAWDTESLKSEEDCIRMNADVRLSPREMAFYEDYMILLRNQSVVICNRKNNDVHEIKFDDKFPGKMINFIRIGKKVYVYRDSECLLISTNGAQSNDWIHMIDLESHKCEKDMKVRIMPSLSAPDHTPGRVRKFIRSSKQIYLLAQDDESAKALVYRFNDCSDDGTCYLSGFSNGSRRTPVHMSTYKIPVGNKRICFSRKYLTQVPLYMHPCSHETLLQTHLRQLSRANRAEQLEKLGPFVC